jgi:hypothetical protein
MSPQTREGMVEMVDKRRLGRRIRCLSAERMLDIARAIPISLADEYLDDGMDASMMGTKRMAGDRILQAPGVGGAP